MVVGKEKIFDILIKDYLKRATPIGSKYIKKKYLKKIPSSTIRWYLRKLAEENLIENVDKYAGRIPTDKGWRFYLEKYKDYYKLNKDYGFKKLKNEEEKIEWLTKKFLLYSVVFDDKDNCSENGLEYIIKNIEFKNLINFSKLAYLIKKIKEGKIDIDFKPNNLIILIGKEIKINNLDNFSIFCWRKYNNKYFLISTKRINYPEIYFLLIKNFL